MKKKPLARFIRRPTFSTTIPNAVRGVLSLGVTLLCGYVLVATVEEAYQFDVDGEIGIGRVNSVMERSTRRRRRSWSVRYELQLSTHHGLISVSSDSNVPVGRAVRYIFSPKSADAMLAPEPLQRGDMLWHQLWSFRTVCVLFALVACGYYAYDQFRWVYVVVSGRFTIKGKADLA